VAGAASAEAAASAAAVAAAGVVRVGVVCGNRCLHWRPQQQLKYLGMHKWLRQRVWGQVRWRPAEALRLTRCEICLSA
jgi:hypothetical protein